MQMSGEYCFNTSIRLDNRIRKAKPIEDNRESKIRDTEKKFKFAGRACKHRLFLLFAEQKNRRGG